ncbi:MAG: hypothetical protein IPF70_16630 [Saprospiraceae bacterium]|nr:hypothetical protein [Saprospiraceae bacterium]
MKSFFLHFVFSIVGFSMNAQSLNIKESPDTRKNWKLQKIKRLSIQYKSGRP